MLLLCTAVYLPGIAGPWMFDDYTNIINNSYVHVSSLDGSSLQKAAFSVESGPLRRPISLASFALNYFFTGDLNNSLPFKITNLVIHLLNSLLVFWLASLIFQHTRAPVKTPAFRAQQARGAVYVLAACTALIWSIHPLQLTSVLYVVQRMTELAATFTVLGLICYLYGREQMLAGRKIRGLWLALTGLVGGGTLGILSKENAALLPLFAILIEFFLFPDKSPWDNWRRLSVSRKRAFTFLALLVVLALLLLTLAYAIPRYQNREFTLLERLMTESRVLFFYISLLFVPNITRLGHQHDDITVSSSLLIPWTTLPSMLGIVCLIATGFWLRKRNPLLGLGILWFFTGHLMESTILPLEIAHEHRNYLPSFGFALGIASVLASLSRSAHRRRRVWVAYAAIVMALAGTTYVRAGQWGDHVSLYQSEVAHHPRSARAHVGYGTLLEAHGRHEEAQQAIRRAVALDPHEAGYVMEILLLDARQKQRSEAADYDEVLRRLSHERISATTILTLNRVDDCLTKWCGALLPHFERWIETILEKPDAPDPYYFQYRLGRIKAIQGKYLEALNLFQAAHEGDKQFLHPLFEQIAIFLKLGQIDNAEYMLARLKESNARSRYPRDWEIARIEGDIRGLRNQRKQP
jgi:tetratricopeptide (TPR) repeat protein